MNREECLDWLYRLRGEIYVYIQPKEWLIPMNNALDMAIKALEQEPVLDKIRAEIERQEKWLLQAGYTTYNVDIAFDAIKSVLAERSDKE